MPLKANFGYLTQWCFQEEFGEGGSHYFPLFAEAVLELHHIAVFEVPGLPKELRENSIRNDAG